MTELEMTQPHSLVGYLTRSCKLPAVLHVGFTNYAAQPRLSISVTANQGIMFPSIDYWADESLEDSKSVLSSSTIDMIPQVSILLVEEIGCQ